MEEGGKGERERDGGFEIEGGRKRWRERQGG